MYLNIIYSGKPLVSFVHVGNPISFEINMFKPNINDYACVTIIIYKELREIIF